MTAETSILGLIGVLLLWKVCTWAATRRQQRANFLEMQLRLEAAWETLRPPHLEGTYRWPRLPSGSLAPGPAKAAKKRPVHARDI